MSITSLAGTGFPDSILTGVQLLEGVETAAPLVLSAVDVEGRPTTLVGVNAFLADLLDGDAPDVGAWFDAPDDDPWAAFHQVVLGPVVAGRLGVRVGDRVALADEHLEVVGVLEGAIADRVDGGNFVLTLVPAAQRLTGRPRLLDQIFVIGAVDPQILAARIDGVVGGRAVVTVAGETVDRLGEDVEVLTRFLALIGVLVAALLVAAVSDLFVVAATERRRELALFRAVGATNRQVLSGLATDAAVVGAAGAGVGIVAAVVAAPALVGVLPPMTEVLLQVPIDVQVPVTPLVVLAGAVVAVAVATAVATARRVTQVSPVEAAISRALDPEEARSRRRSRVLTTAGLTVLFASVVALAASGSPVAVVTAGLGLSIGLRGGASLATRHLRKWSSARSVVGLALGSVAVAPQRARFVVGVFALSVLTVVAAGGLPRRLAESVDATVAEVDRIETVVQTGPEGVLPVADPLPAELEAALVADGGVGGRSLVVVTTTGRAMLVGLDPGAVHPLLSHVGEGDASAFVAGSDTVVVSRRVADDEGLHVGSEWTLLTPMGPRTVSVVAVADVGTAEDAALPLDRLQSWYLTQGRTFVQTAEPFTRATDGSVHVLTGRQAAAAYRQPAIFVTRVFGLVAALVVATGALVTAGLVRLAAANRRREIQLLRIVGLDARRAAALVALDTMGLAAIGTALGLVVGGAAHWAMRPVIADAIGLRLAPMPDVWWSLATAIGALVVAALASAGPARRLATLSLTS